MPSRTSLLNAENSQTAFNDTIPCIIGRFVILKIYLKVIVYLLLIILVLDSMPVVSTNIHVEVYFNYFLSLETAISPVNRSQG